MFDYQTSGRRRNRVSDYNMFQTISNGDRFFRKAGTDMERKSEIVSFSVQWTLKVDGRRVQFVLCASQNNWNLFLLLFLTQWEPVSVWERKLLSIYSQRTGTQLRLLMWIYLFFLFKNKRSCCFVPRRSFIYFSSFSFSLTLGNTSFPSSFFASNYRGLVASGAPQEACSQTRL